VGQKKKRCPKGTSVQVFSRVLSAKKEESRLKQERGIKGQPAQKKVEREGKNKLAKLFLHDPQRVRGNRGKDKKTTWSFLRKGGFSTRKRAGWMGGGKKREKKPRGGGDQVTSIR